MSPALQADSLPSEPPGKPKATITSIIPFHFYHHLQMKKWRFRELNNFAIKSAIWWLKEISVALNFLMQFPINFEAQPDF